MFLLGYIRRGNFIDGLHSPAHGTPCHFCRMAWLADDERCVMGPSETTRGDSWYRFRRKLGAHGIECSPSCRQPGGAGLALFHGQASLSLVSSFAAMTPPDLAQAARTVSLSSGQVGIVAVAHHPLCACLHYDP